jgi:3-oxoacyl-[acyl-carrier-protein] synthase-1
MASQARALVTGIGALCATGTDVEAIWDAVVAESSAIGPISKWDASAWPVGIAAEITGVSPRTLVPDRKLHKFIRRTDMFGLYAASAAIDASALATYRDGLEPALAATFSDRSGIFDGSGGGAYETQYDYFPLLDAADGSLEAFGRELDSNVSPMWLLQTLPNNVLCHVGIRYGLKGTNACITSHSASSLLAVIEGVEALRANEADRAVVVAHDALIEPQSLLYYDAAGLLSSEALRPFDSRRDGSVFGEGAAAIVVETEESARERGAAVFGEILGGAETADALGVLEIGNDGDGLARAIALALDDAGLVAEDVGMVIAHGNGTQRSDRTEAAAIRSVFGAGVPPMTSFKWSFGHLIAASGMLDVVLALECLRRGVVPRIGTLEMPDPDFDDLPIAQVAGVPTSDVALVLNRGFAGTNSAVLVRAARPL